MIWPFNGDKPCACDGCTGREPNRSKSPYVSHGLRMWVGKDGKLHWRSKSRLLHEFSRY